MLATPGERGVIGRGQVETQHPEDRRQEAFSLPQGQVEDEPERQRGFDGEIGIRPLPAALVHNSRSRSIIALRPEIRGPA